MNMSEHAEKHRKEGRAKVQRYLRKDPGGKIDASGYKPPDELMADVKTGLRPISKRQFKKGGRVHGEDAKHHACRKTRQVGGSVNEDTKKANKHRAGEKHVGGFKKGGEARKHRDAGGPAVTGGPIANLPQVPTSGLYGSGFAPSKAGALASAAGLKRGGRTHKSHGGNFSPAATADDMVRNGYAADWSSGAGAGAPAPAPAPSRAPAPQRREAPMPPPRPQAQSAAPTMSDPRGQDATMSRLGGPADTFSPPPDAPRGSPPPDAPSGSLGHGWLDSMIHGHLGPISWGSDAAPNGGASGQYRRGGKVRNPGNDRITGTAPTGGRLAKADGGRTKKGAVNIVIAVGGHKPEEGAGGPPGPMGPPLAHPPIPPQPVGGAAAGVAPNGGMPMPGGAPPMQMPPPNMGRKHGGSVKYAAGGGEGRLDKIRKYGKGV